MLINNILTNNAFYPLQTELWANNQRIAGKVAAQTLSTLDNLIKNKATNNLIELDKIAEDMILSSGCIPTFKNHNGFPNTTCISVNKQVVHGIPSNIPLQDGDVITFDLGVTYEDAIADTAITCIYGNQNNEYKKLINVANEALYKAIKSIEIDKHIGIIGNTIYKSVKSYGFNVVTQYGGHCIGKNELHLGPFIANKSNIYDGIRIQPGMSIAIEPIVGIGDNSVKLDSNGWTVYTNSIFVHVEHTIFVHQDSIEIMTLRNDENYI
jgi:methionyl aminopeptidase